jgi:integrase/recombinase XerD
MSTLISAQRVIHQQQVKIALHFPYDRNLIEEIKKIKDSQWSYSQRAWLLPDLDEKIAELEKLIQGKADLNKEKLRLSKPGLPEIKNSASRHLPVLSLEMDEKVTRFRNWMRSRRYSESTVNTYSEALIIFLRFYPTKNLNQITNDDLIRFNNEYILENKLSASYQNQVVNGVKLFFRTVENRKLEIELIHRPKTQKLLPNIFSKEEENTGFAFEHQT